MGGQQGKISSTSEATSTDDSTFYDLNVIPSKAVFTPATEDITGQVILDLRKPFTRPGIIVISLDGKESFEYAPFGGSVSKQSCNHHHGIQRNENKFLREREVLAQFGSIAVGRHVFNFNFSLNGTQIRIPPSVNICQEVKGQGIIDLKCTYKVGVSIYDTSQRVDKIVKVEFPILVKEAQPQKSMRKNFIEMGQSEVVSCLSGLGTGGICSFQVKCTKDCFIDEEMIPIQAKIDNTRSKQSVKKVEVKLLRYIRLHTQQIAPGATSSSYDLVLTQELSRTKHQGIPARYRDIMFHRDYNVSLDQIFTKERSEKDDGVQEDGEDAVNEADFDEYVVEDGALYADRHPTLLAPSSYGKTFMIHYAVQISLKHPGIFSQPTQLELDISIDTSRKDYRLQEKLISNVREKANKILLLNRP